MKVLEEVTIGKFKLCQKEYANLFWIYKDDGEGAALNEESLKKLEELLANFFKEIM